ncbi:MAG TPA: CehA/McbA family metallohydrolase, partial [Bryobacteraceae bacterium]|nr:CehA/McbA family metallohydrolase [Bryobacteraceae bacterium]
EWLKSATPGRGERQRRVTSARELYLEITASPEATLALTDSKSGRRYTFELSRATESGIPAEQARGARIEFLEQRKTWLHGQVVDAATGRPVPVRIAFRSREGRYIPPYGHRTEINRGWFQDYGADLALGGDSFAYIDGTFQVELPVGEVYVELSRGFEYEAVRRRIDIQPGQRELRLEIKRIADWRSRGWISADSHVHFLSPSTALLEAHAEGLNAINLLAAQWRDLFTNVGDLYHGHVRSRDGEAMVWMGTENRQHLLGHLALHGAQVFPMSAAGPGESYLGDPVHNSLAGWADESREREGLAIAVHFPYPNGELAADIALGKIDAVEVYPYGEHTNTARFLDWYRYLNCGYRLPVVGGTDKMSASMPAGANRTYAHIGGDELSFESWAKAVRAGRTFMTTGPLIAFEADGRVPGDEIRIPAGGGSVEVRASVISAVPVHRLQVVMNGRVVASREEAAGARQMELRETIKVTGPAWIAARCASKLGAQTAWPFGIQAHTSPIYLTMPGRELFSPDAAAYMLTLIDASEAWLRTLATRPDDPEQFARILKVCADARERLHQRLHAHGVRH